MLVSIYLPIYRVPQAVKLQSWYLQLWEPQIAYKNKTVDIIKRKKIYKAIKKYPNSHTNVAVTPGKSCFQQYCYYGKWHDGWRQMWHVLQAAYVPRATEQQTARRQPTARFGKLRHVQCPLGKVDTLSKHLWAVQTRRLNRVSLWNLTMSPPTKLTFWC